MKTYCIVIGAPLVVQHCPLKPTSCTWQHRATNFCKYTNRELSVEEHAELVGATVPSSALAQDLEHQLVDRIRSEL